MAVKPKLSMGDWKKRKLIKGLRASQTTGKSKGIHPTQLAKTMCRRNRSYKNPEYSAVMATLGKRGKTK
jgi:hypothetical protein